MAGMEKVEKFDVKLPSDATKVTVSNLWSYCLAIARTGKTFEAKDLLKANPPHTSEDPMRRNLAYLKYLGFLDEKREKLVKDGKKVNIQRFNQRVKDALVKDFFYLLASGRKDEARTHWRRLIEKHAIFKLVKSKLFKETDLATLNDLEDLLRIQDNSKSNPQFYKSGALFVASLLEEAGLIKYNSVEGKLRPLSPEERTEGEEAAPGFANEPLGIKENLEKGEEYLVSIRGADLNLDFKVRTT